MTDGNGTERAGYVLFVWSPTGWTLQRARRRPAGRRRDVEAGRRAMLRVSKLGPSPLPGDTRAAARTSLASAR